MVSYCMVVALLKSDFKNKTGENEEVDIQNIAKNTSPTRACAHARERTS